MMNEFLAWYSGVSAPLVPVMSVLALKSIVVLGLAGLLTALMGRRSASARHLVWALSVGALIALPVFSVLLPPTEIRVAGPWQAARPEVEAVPAFGIPEQARLATAETNTAPAPSRISSSAPASTGTSAPYAPTEENAGSAGLAPIVSQAFRFVPLVWLFGSLLALAGVPLAIVRIRQLALQAQIVHSDSDRRLVLLRKAALASGVRRTPILLEGSARDMPMTWGFVRSSILLPSESRDWSANWLRTVFDHELAHIRRRDNVIQLIAALARGVYWFNPLVWYASRRLLVEREHACDDLVVAHGSEPAEYADGLLRLARAQKDLRLTAALPMASPSILPARVAAILDERRTRDGISRRSIQTSCVLSAGVFIPLATLSLAPIETPAAEEETVAALELESAVSPGLEAPAIASDQLPVGGEVVSAPAIRLAYSGAGLQECGSRENRAASYSHSTDDDHTELKWSAADCKVRITIEGAVAFNDDFSTIESISPGGRVQIVAENPDGRRELEITPRTAGLSYVWRVDGDERPYDAEAQVWLSERFLQAFRITGYKADERVAWILASQGPEGVFAEIENVRPSHAMAVYMIALLERDLDRDNAEKVIRIAGSRIEADYALSEVLKMAASRYRLTNQMLRDFIEAARTIQSDFEQRRVLDAALQSGRLDSEDMKTLLRVARDIDADYELSELLIALAAQYSLDPTIQAEYLRTAESLGSDHEQQRVLVTLLEEASLGQAELADLLRASASIGAGYARAEVLMRATEHDLSDRVLLDAYFAAVAGVQSNYERARALKAFLVNQKPRQSTLTPLIEATSTIGSDSQRADMLILIANQRSLEAAARAAYLRAAANMKSSFERKRAEDAILAE